ncbi:MAG: helix-turn-helix domain-containing protein [Acidimicrobiales bacterium]|jgi:AcrR family transcriptional regulator
MAPSETPRPLRVDAARNRDAILESARRVFAKSGTDAALEEIARRAHVGIATLYRRFPTREDLVAAAFEPRLRAYEAAAKAAAAAPDPWEGFSGFVRAACSMQAADAGCADVLSLTFPTTTELDRQLRAATAGLSDVVERARTAGALRADFVLEDLVLVLMANAGVVNATKCHAPKAWERFAAYMLDALRAPGASPLPKPTSPARLARAIRRSPERR